MQLAGIAAVVIAATLGCVPPSSQGRPAAAESVADTTPYTHVYADALKRAVPSLSSQIDAASPSAIHVTPDTSRAMAVIYRWVVFVPPGSSDRFVQILVAPASGSVMELRSAADWKTLADRLGWQPETADQALRGCWDMIRSVGPRRNVVWPPFLYVDSTSLRNSAVMGAEMLQVRLTPPRIDKGHGEWTVVAWFVESGRSSQYECKLGRTAATYDLRQTIDGLGFPRIGP